MGDKLVFILPDSLEELLWAVPVVVQYLVQRLASKRRPDKVFIICRWEQGHSFLRACWAGVVVESSLSAEARDQADFIFEFDAEKVYNLTKNTAKHITEAYALQIGAGSVATNFPPIAEKFGERDGLVLVSGKTWMETDRSTSWPEEDLFIETGKAQEIPIKKLPLDATWEQLIEEVSRASVVVGISSATTLLAATMGKLVVELCSDKKHRRWTTKWCGKRYRMFYGKMEEMKAEMVWERTQSLLETLRR